MLLDRILREDFKMSRTSVLIRPVNSVTIFGDIFCKSIFSVK